jgi:hypothetical protein
MLTLEDSAIFDRACCKLSGFQRILKMRGWNVEHHGNWSLVVFLVWKGKVCFQNSCRKIPWSCCLWSPTAVEWTIKFKKSLSFHRDSFLKSIESSSPLIVIGMRWLEFGWNVLFSVRSPIGGPLHQQDYYKKIVSALWHTSSTGLYTLIVCLLMCLLVVFGPLFVVIHACFLTVGC